MFYFFGERLDPAAGPGPHFLRAFESAPTVPYARRVDACMSHVKPAFSLGASASQSCCGTSQTFVTSAVVATMPLSSTFTALPSAAGSQATLRWVRFREVDQAILAWLASLALSRMGQQVSRIDDGDAPFGSGGEVLSTRGCFAAVAEGTSRAYLAYPTCSWLPVPLQFSLATQQISVAVPGRAPGTNGSGAFQMGSFRSGLWWPAPRCCRGFPRCPFRVCDGFRRPTLVLCQSRDRSRAEKLEPCSQQCVRPCASPCPINSRVQRVSWLLCKCAPGLRARINSPNGNTG